MEFFYSSGLRLAELVGLNLCDMDLRDRTVRVLGKGSRERIVLPQLRETMMLCTINQGCAGRPESLKRLALRAWRSQSPPIHKRAVARSMARCTLKQELCSTGRLTEATLSASPHRRRASAHAVLAP